MTQKLYFLKGFELYTAQDHYKPTPSPRQCLEFRSRVLLVKGAQQ